MTNNVEIFTAAVALIIKADLVWNITKANVNWGRVRIANQLALLNIFLSASTVRNIINRPKPPSAPKPVSKPKPADAEKVHPGLVSQSCLVH
jgi:hypothetical protein